MSTTLPSDIVRSMLKGEDTHIIINEEGNFVQTYRKLHIFDVDL